jgi:exosortase
MGASAQTRPVAHSLSGLSASTLASFAILAIGVALFAVPTMVFVVEEYWSAETGAHGPIVLFTGIWLLWRQWPEAIKYREVPRGFQVWAALAVFVVLQVIARITQIVELEGFLMYGALLTVLYAFVGGEVMKKLWFPLFYIAFIFPPPETVVAAVTVPMKMWLSVAAIRFLDLFGYPIGGEGVRIYIGQYELLVAAACAGLNSIVSLTAISLFYIYVRHQAEWRYAAFLVLFIVPIALLANFVRVLILILLTYYSGEAAAQGFMHNFAGIVMFAVAIASVFGLDSVLKPLWNRYVSNERQEAANV